MGRNDAVTLDYSRQSLRKATKFVEGDYSGLNPRQFYRSLKRGLEEIQEGGSFKYTTHGLQETDLTIESEQVGAKTGKVRGRLMATSEPRTIGAGQIEYKPYGPHGALSLVVGALVFLLGLSDLSFAVLGLLLMISGGYLYFQTSTGEFPVKREDVIRALMTGEVSERTIEDGFEVRTDIFANMSVIYAGDALLTVSVSDVEDMNWRLRRAVANQVKRWHNRVVENEEDRLTVDEGFFAQLSLWSNRSLDTDRETIRRRQKTINDQFETRIGYSDILMEQLRDEYRDELSKHQDGLLDELESLSDDMNVYVERKGLKTLR